MSVSADCASAVSNVAANAVTVFFIALTARNQNGAKNMGHDRK